MSKDEGTILDDGAQKIYEELDGLDTGSFRFAAPVDAEGRPDQAAAVLDAEAQRIYAEFGGLDTQSRTSDIIGWSTGLAKVLSLEVKVVDAWRVVLIEFAHRLALCLAGFTLAFDDLSPDDDIEVLLDTLSRLARMPNHGGSLLVRYRGLGPAGGVDASGMVDYTVSFGNMVLDIPAATATAKRDLATLYESPTRLKKAFERLAAVNIDSIRIAIGGWGPVDRERMRDCVQILRRYCMEVAGEKPITFEGGEDEPVSSVVHNELYQPDPNLTLLAGLNGLKPGVVRGLVKQVDKFMRQPGTAPTLDQYANVFEAIFAFRNLRLQIVKPPVEVNNVRWLIADETGAAPRNEIRGARQVMERFGQEPQKASRVIDGLYRRDYGGLPLENLSRRLESVSEYLDVLGDSPAESDLVADVLTTVYRRMDEVRSEVLEDLKVGENRLTWTDAMDRPQGIGLNPRLFECLSFVLKRHDIKVKIKAAVGGPVRFDDTDYDIVANDFNVTRDNARHLLGLLTGCFGPDGRFMRSNFESSIPEFAKHGDRVFEFLWHYLKEAMIRADRVSFLNAMQMFIDRMHQHEAALNILLEDFISAPDAVYYHDRNAIMLAVVMTRKYNKELTTDLEFTPEEVLLVTDGLDMPVIKAAGGIISRNQERFFQKVKAIHKYLKDALDTDEEEAQPPMPVGYLVTLEKETFILLSLVGDPAAHAIVRSAVIEYGDPDSEIYRRRQSRRHFDKIFPVLETALRGLARFDDPADRILMEDVRVMEKAFVGFRADDEAHRKLVRRVLRYARRS